MSKIFCFVMLFVFSIQGFCIEDSHMYNTRSLLKILRTNGGQNNLVVQNGELGLMLPNYGDSTLAVNFFSIKELLQKLQKMENDIAQSICDQNSATTVTLSLGVMSATWEREKLCQKKPNEGTMQK